MKFDTLIAYWPFPAGDMLDLLKWRAHPDRISDSLSKLKEIDGSEIVKVSLLLVNEPVNHSDLPPNWCMFTNKVKYLQSVFTGYTGHAFRHFGRELTKICTQGV